ncbi:MAG TPA: acyltransferase family protein [Bacillota bacterium]|nr:acyltransferase family protein [Bacillota bacterium]
MNIVRNTKTLPTGSPLAPHPSNRLTYIDNIRWVMIILVVMMHIKVTYGMEGSWYYVEKSRIDLISQVIFGMYGSWVQAFFMGFLFLIAGYFVPSSYDKKGVSGFLKGRLIRLGIPTLIFMLVLNPLTMLLIAVFSHQSVNVPLAYLGYVTSFAFLNGSGPLWFAFALLIFSAVYALVRRFGSSTSTKRPVEITNQNVWAVILIIAVITFWVRIVQPIGTDFLNMQLCFFTQYIILFILGILAYRYHWLENLPTTFAKHWFKIAVFIGIPFWFAMFFAGGVLTQGAQRFMGGFYWQSAVYAFWESFFCVSVCLGLLGLFRERFNRKRLLRSFLSDNAFGVYVFHTPILVLISLSLSEFHIHPLVKFLVVSLITLPICFGFSHLIRRIPVFKKIFS